MTTLAQLLRRSLPVVSVSAFAAPAYAWAQEQDKSLHPPVAESEGNEGTGSTSNPGLPRFDTVRRMRSYESRRRARDRRKQADRARAARFRVHRVKESAENLALLRQATQIKVQELDRGLEHLGLTVGSSALKGRREAMEDAHVQACTCMGGEPLVFFGVFDGHGGTRTSRHLARSLHRNLFAELETRPEEVLRRGLDAQDNTGHRESDGLRQQTGASCVQGGKGHEPDPIVAAIERACAQTDAEVLADSPDDLSGSTAVFLLFVGRNVYAASVGDSQAVLGAACGRAHNLCALHRPGDEKERVRIEQAGGFVEHGRVLGLLGITRAFGDRDFKLAPSEQSPASSCEYEQSHEPMHSEQALEEENRGFSEDLVTAVPHVVHRMVQKTDEFIVLGCDGLFDVMTEQDVVDFVRVRFASGISVSETADMLVQRAIHGLGSTDNVSVIIVQLKHSTEEIQGTSEPHENVT